MVTPAAARRPGKADVTTIHFENDTDPEAVRACGGRQIDVGSVTIAGALRER